MIKAYSDEWYIKLYEMDIMRLSMEKKALLKKINEIDTKIEKLRNFNREIKGRPIKA